MKKEDKDLNMQSYLFQKKMLNEPFQQIFSLALITVCVLIFIFVLIINAWVCDDAYITFRTIDNFVNGYGLTWNTTERVQTYTNPLWMFLLSGIYFFSREIYYTNIIFSIIISVATVLFFAFKISTSFLLASLGITILIFSKAFVDYSTSGLENPLTHLLLALFFFTFIKFKLNFKTLFLLSLIASLGTFNRMDTFLFFLPTLVYAFLKLPKLKGLGVITIGFLPFICWEIFCLFYYGFPFPNSFYAKLKTGVDTMLILKSGFYYLFNSFRIDPLTLLTITTAIITPFFTRKWNYLPLVFGILLYLVYIIKIGGDFMSGRFLTGPLFCSVILLSQYSLSFFKSFLVFILIIFIGSFCSSYPPLFSDANYGMEGFCMDRGIADERAFYYPTSGLLRAQKGIEMPCHPYAEMGKKLQRQKKACYIVHPNIGYLGFYAGPRVYIIDYLGLSNPLIARLPAKDKMRWRSGHCVRMIPYGFLKTLELGENWIHDKDLADYYEKLSFITQGKLFDKRRLLEIWNMNTGKYDGLLNSYINRPMLQVDLRKIEPVNIQLKVGQEVSSILCLANVFVFDKNGLQINLGRQYYGNLIELILENDTYQIIFLNKNLKIYSKVIRSLHTSHQEAILFFRVSIPKEIAQKGYNQIKIIPRSDDNGYIMRHIRILE